MIFMQIKMKNILSNGRLVIATLVFSMCTSYAATSVTSAKLPEKKSKQPNFVFILVDDMAWFGTPVLMDKDIEASRMAFLTMPNVDKLSEQGMVFRNARAAAGMCGPSRCSIQTGMTAAHHLYTGNGGFGPKTDGKVKYIAERGDPPLLTPEPQGNIRFPSIGDVLRANGYATAHFGKWHLYGGGPEKHGYDESNGETDNKSVLDVPPGDNIENPKQIFSITKSGIGFMERQHKAGKPFYLQLSHYATHARYEARPATLKKYEGNPVFSQIKDQRVAKNAIALAAMSEDLDTSIGMILKTIYDLGIAADTYVIFTSDNGFRSWNEGAEPLRGAKWWNWDCGLRVPMIVRGPGIKSHTRCNVNVVGYDFLPTIADLAGATASVPKAVDGVSFKALLLGQTVPGDYVNRKIFFHYPHYRSSAPSSAIVAGQMKLLYFYDHPGKYYLFDLAKDLGERNNIAPADPEKAGLMFKQLMDGLHSANAFFPKPNPNANPNAKVYDPDNLNEQSSGTDH